MDFDILFLGSFYLWAAFELVNTLIIGRRRRHDRSRDHGSYWAVLIATYSAFILIVVFREWHFRLLPVFFQWIGLAILWIGVLVRQWAVFSLGRSFSVIVEVRPGQHLVTSGPYRWIRHPAYTGSLLTIGGFGLAAGSWLGTVLPLSILLAGYTYRVRVEEKAMLSVFGDEYRDYMRHTGRFFPLLPFYQRIFRAD